MKDLTKYIKETERTGDKILSEIIQKREQLQIYEFLVGYHLFKNKLIKIKEKNEVKTAKVSMNIYSGASGEYILGSYVYSLTRLSDIDNEKIKELDMDIYSSISAICPMPKSKFGNIQDNGIDLFIDKLDLDDLDYTILCSDFRTIYTNSLLEINLSTNSNATQLKTKV